MASRPELVQMCKELDIDSDGLSIDEMDTEVREEIDRRFDKSIMIGNSGLSKTLLRFMSEEYDYYFYNEEGQEVNYKGEEVWGVGFFMIGGIFMSLDYIGTVENVIKYKDILATRL